MYVNLNPKSAWIKPRKGLPLVGTKYLTWRRTAVRTAGG